MLNANEARLKTKVKIKRERIKKEFKKKIPDDSKLVERLMKKELVEVEGAIMGAMNLGKNSISFSPKGPKKDKVIDAIAVELNKLNYTAEKKEINGRLALEISWK